ncbi:hypothetical protein QTL95_00645 [Rhizobium sp. S152]|nr:hypothetical protein [Rhizobium sp. S152]MDM9624383.1 hypothetical protein [Rhizobium sp. S152]
MTQLLLNSAVAILIAAGFLATATAALRGEDRALQKVPVKVRARRHPKG